MHRIEMPTSPPDRAEMDGILRDYYGVVIGRLVADGGPQVDPDESIADFWDHIEEFLPPRGRLCLARNETGHLVGCGTLSDLGDGSGEMKRLFVRPEARGTGLGRSLVEARIDAAREMGLKRLLVDTLRLNVEMQGIYAQLGFERIDGYAQSGTLRGFPEVAPFLLFYKLELG